MKLTKLCLISLLKVVQPFRRNKETGSGCYQNRSRALRTVLCKREMVSGMLTNFKTIQSRIARLKEIEAMEADGTFDVLPKKEVIALKKEWEKLEKNLGVSKR